MRIYVTGASGLLGATAVHTLRERHDVGGSYKSHPMAVPGAELRTVDLADFPTLFEELEAFKPEVVIHCAAETRVDYCENHADEALRANVTCTENVASACRELGSLLVHISTDGIFDGSSAPYREDDPPNPLNVYAHTKALSERVVRDRCTEHLIVRTNMFGWNMHRRKSLAEWILQQLNEGQEFPAFADVHFNPLLTNDLVDIVEKMIQTKLRGTYHAGASDSCTKYAFAQQLARSFGCVFTGRESRLLDAGLPARRPLNTTTITSRLTDALQRSLPTISEGISRFRDLELLGFPDMLRSCAMGEEIACQ